MKVSKSELEIIRKQLGREPDNLGGIPLKCPFEKPAVLLTLPYSSDKGIFPTTFWLSCPYLVKEVSRLEEKGLVKELTEKINKNPALKEELERAHKIYAQKRRSLLGEDEVAELRRGSPDILKVLLESGGGGESEIKKVLNVSIPTWLIIWLTGLIL